MRKLMLMAILTATIDPVVAQVACPNPVPDEPTRTQIVACLGEIHKLLADIQQLKGATARGRFIPQTFGAGGAQHPPPAPDQGDYTSVNSPPSRGTIVTSLNEYPICTVSHIRAGGGQCALQQVGADWKVFVDGNASCRVTCFKWALP
jgi:hypothetical protein